MAFLKAIMKNTEVQKKSYVYQNPPNIFFFPTSDRELARADGLPADISIFSDLQLKRSTEKMHLYNIKSLKFLWHQNWGKNQEHYPWLFLSNLLCWVSFYFIYVHNKLGKKKIEGKKKKNERSNSLSKLFFHRGALMQIRQNDFSS